jgi:multidrug efflux pump subunit AcrA (membrane-fusion protein)
LLNDYTIPSKKASFEVAVTKAATEQEKTFKQNAALWRSKLQAVEACRRDMDRVESDVGAARKELESLEVHAPADGIVMYGDPEETWRRGEIQVGGTFHPGQVLMTIPDRTEVQAVVNIPESDIQNVRTGQTATITVEALPDRAFQGKVTKVWEVANAGGWWSSDVKEFKVEVSVRDGAELRPGFSCEVEIVTDVIPSARYLPVQAVFRDGDRYVVYPADRAGAPLDVKLGRASTAFVEIPNDLVPGTRVLLNPPAKPRGKP